jgi:uncharacterized protein YfaS (alpha-2-macroglobulin family)
MSDRRPPPTRDRTHLAVTLGAEGDATLSYQVSLSHVPANADQAANAGIAVSTPLRTRFGVLGDRASVAAGEIVAIDVSLQTQARREHVAVEIPLPAGLEPFALDLGQRANVLPTHLAPLRQVVVVSEEYHADRIRLFLRRLDPGLPRRYTVYAYAKVPGTFTMPGARAEALYTPTVRGRATTRRIRVTLPDEEGG